MTPNDSLSQLAADTWLRDNPVAAHLGSDEAVEFVLRNREVGLERAGTDDGQIPPAEDCGAVAILTDRRVLFLVGDPPTRTGDHVESVAYENVVEAVAKTETLTQRVLVETEETTYSFTARETNTVADVQSFLETAGEVYAACETHFGTAASARKTLETALDAADWERCSTAVEEARDALDAASTLAADTPFDPLGERVDELTDDIDELAGVAHRRQAEALADESEQLLDTHEYEASHDRLQAARHHVEAAASLLSDPTAAADGGTTAVSGTVADTRTRIDQLAGTITARPVADAEEYYQTAQEATDRHDRIDALESAFSCYQSAATLLADEQSPFEGDQGATREDAERVIGALIEAHLDAARDDRAAGEFERDADNPASAHELLTDALAAAERALELAQAYPPGDHSTIEAERDRIKRLLDPLRIEVELTETDRVEADAESQ